MVESTYEEHVLALTCPTMAALISARETGDWPSIRRAARLHSGWLRESGRVPAVEQEDKNLFGLGHQTASRQRHHTH